MKMWAAAGIATMGVVAVSLSAPLRANPASPLAAGFTDAICHAKPPRLAHAWANAIDTVPAGSIVRVADTTISNADHAELLFKLGLLEGHLRIGRELISANQAQLALPHFGHPIRELYDDISGELARRGVTCFDGELVSLEALAAGKPGDPAMIAQYDKVIRILAALRATVPSELMNDERFMLGVLGEVATIASEDYSESIEGGRIEKPVEYHDSRGYLEYADGELKRLEARQDLQGSSKLKAARGKLLEMQAIVGPLIPPDRPIRTVAEYKAIVVHFKQATGPAA